LKSVKGRNDIVELGPFAGAVTSTSVVFILKTTQPAKVRIQLSEKTDFSNAFFTGEFESDKENYNYVKPEINNLKPNTKYFYRAVVDDYPADKVHYFLTFPSDMAYSFSFGFGSCQQQGRGSSSNIFSVIAKDSLRFFIHLGDWVYADYTIDLNFNNSMSLIERSYRLKYDYSYPFARDILSKMPIVYTYDDHDYAGNDKDGTVSNKQYSIKAYDTFFPHYKLENPGNGIWQQFSIGDVDFFVLDLRTQRSSSSEAFNSSGEFSPPASHSILAGFNISGTDQKTWFLNALKSSSAKWKVIVSSVIFNPRYFDAAVDERINKYYPQIRRGVIDKWAGYPEDMLDLIKTVQNDNIKNVIIVSGDSHSSYIDDGTNSVMPEISSSNLDVRNNRLGLLTSLAGYNIWNQGSYNSDGHAYGKVSFIYGEENYALLEIIDDSGNAVVSYRLPEK